MPDLPSTPPVDSIPVRIKVNPKDIIYLHGILEAYDHLAVARTLDSREGTMELLASPFFVTDLHELLHGLSEEMSLEILEDGDRP